MKLQKSLTVSIRCGKITFMSSKQDKGFDLPALIRLNLLEVRKVAQKNLFLTVGEYFSLLYRFKSEGPRASEALGELS